MKLYEHPDFDQAILRASEHFREQGLRPAIIEKDYYVTEALRVIAASSDGLLPDIVQLAARFGLRDLAITEPSLETVFIQLTGRDLRE